MKRISILAAVILMVAISVTEGHSYYWSGSTYDYRVRWSIYTQSLVSGDVHYSPYAYDYDHSGLVPYWVRYSPYAFSYEHSSGLVNDYESSQSSTKYIYYLPYDSSCPNFGWVVQSGVAAADCSPHASHPERAGVRYAQKIETRKQRARQVAKSSSQERATRETGGSRIIAAYLAGRNIEFRMDRLLQIEGKTISADFLLPGSNVLIKYWDPAEIAALGQQSERRKLAYDNYLESWKSYCGEYQQAGGKIYQIVSADSDEILAKLADCNELNGPERIYAATQSNTAAIEKP
jgi:hypothetical protein